METRFLETFLCVAERGSLAEASRRLGITPVAVAQRIHALETEVGSTLLARSGRRVKPTDAGYAIIAQAQRIIADIRSLPSLAKTELGSGELRLGAIATALSGLLPAALSELARDKPGLNIFLLPGTSSDLYRQLVDHKIDAAIMVEPPFPMSKSLQWQPLRHERLIVLCPASMKDRDPLDILRSEPFIRYDRNNWGGQMPDCYLRDNAIQPLERYELDSLDTIALMVKSGLGVSLVPDWILPWPDEQKIARLPVPGPQPTRNIGIAWPRSSPVALLIRTMTEAVIRTAPSAGQGLLSHQPALAHDRGTG